MNALDRQLAGAGSGIGDYAPARIEEQFADGVSESDAGSGKDLRSLDLKYWVGRRGIILIALHCGGGLALSRSSPDSKPRAGGIQRGA